MRHGFLQTKIVQLQVLGPELITQLEFSYHPNNPTMYYELAKWPSNMSAKEVKDSLVEMGATMYLLDNEGNIVIEENSDFDVIKGTQEDVHTRK